MPSQDIHGDWTRVTDSSAAGGAALQNPDRGRGKIAPALAAPANYFEMAFDADQGVAYHLWVRLRAQNNATANDSVHLQFSDTVTSNGAATARIGTTQSQEVVLQDGSSGATPLNWGWADNGWGTAGQPIYFARTGTHIVRIQQREDGAIVDQIVLSPDTYATVPPGPLRNDATIRPATDRASASDVASAGSIVLWTGTAGAATTFGAWQRVTDSTAAGGAALRNPNNGIAKIAPALAAPANYFEMKFSASAGQPYHVWVRMRAIDDSKANDSVHLQFNDATTSGGGAFARIGTTGSMEFVLQAGPGGAAPHLWGWADNGWGSLGPHVYFANSGTHTLRVQQREDGVLIDQIVISPDGYLTVAPGPRRDDSRILPATTSTANQPPTATLTSPSTGASYTAPATISLAATASDPENRLARVDFYSGTTFLGSDTAAPFTWSWASVPAGSYSLRAIAFDADGGQGTSATATVTVATSSPPKTYAVEFSASSNHATSVTSYRLNVYANGANPSTATPIATSDLGKPTPNASNVIRVDRTSLLGGLSPATYVTTVTAIGPGGQAQSAPFTFVR